MDRLCLVYLLEHYFSVNFHFPENDKRYKRDFFTIYTIDDGLCFGGIKSILLSDNIFLVLYNIYDNMSNVYKTNGSNQRYRINRNESHSKEQIKMRRMTFSEFCGIEFSIENVFTIFRYFYQKTFFWENSYTRYC